MKTAMSRVPPEALGDFWTVLERSRAAVDDAVLGVARQVETFARILGAMDPAEHEARQRRSRELERAALLEQRWDEYLEDLRQQGAAYAQLGVHFEDWFALLHAYRMTIVPGLFEAFGAEPRRLQLAMEAMNNFLDQAMATIGSAYISTKEAMIRAQEEQLAEHIAELERSNKDLDDFAYVASHDLRAPLRDVDNLAQWIIEDVADALPPSSAQHLSKLRQRISRMDRLLDDLLQYSRAGRLRETPVELQLAHVIRQTRELIVAPEEFRIEWPAGDAVLRTPSAALCQVLRNLVQNAVKHHDRPDGTVRVSVEDEGRWLRFTISDDGPGIPPEFHQRIFRMFQTLRPRDDVEGSGMGLALVKKLVEAYGGAVAIASGRGRGTTFTFTWPKDWSRGPTATNQKERHS